MADDSLESRRDRKEGGKLKKRQRIEESGGTRPRALKSTRANADDSATNASSGKTKRFSDSGPVKEQRGTLPSNGLDRHKALPSSHRFGQVMEAVPCRNEPRFSTVSIAVPGSVLSNCQTRELRTLMVGQIARAATIYHVDEIIVFDDKLGRNVNHQSSWRRNRDPKRDHDHKRGEEGKSEVPVEKSEVPVEKPEKTDEERERRPRSTPQEFMARLLQYCECPQYLRRHFFPMHPDLQFAGLLAPVDAPHHVRADDRSPFRDGVIIQKKSKTGGSLVNCGIRNRPVEIDRKLAPGIRCTVKIDPALYGKPGPMKGTVVSPSAPREANGMYWGYTTRMANSINEVFDGCPFEEGYDLKIGTSERGDKTVEENTFKLPAYEHSLIVFGGVAGIEECVDADESIKLPGSQSKKLFDMWLNTCPFQGSRTIRTEEAILISLGQLSAPLAKAARNKEVEEEEETPNVEFSDDAPSDESSSDDADGSENSKESD